MLLECTYCTMNFEGAILADYSIIDPEDPMDGVKYTFAKCPKCLSPILVIQERFIDYNTLYWGNPKVLYPQMDFHINPIIPDKLRETLVEAIQCYKSKSYTATTIMCRRTLEGFCSLKGIKENNLAISIRKLRTDSIINDQLFEWANELRLVGNEAAHDINISFSEADAKDALDFTIAILDFTYSFKDKFDKFKIRRQKDRS